MRCLYILEIGPLSVTLFAKIFSHSVGCLFVFLMVSFAMQKLLSLIRSHWFIYLFIYLFIYFRAAHVAYGSSQAGGQIRAAAASLCHSHCSARSKPRLWTMPQLMAMPDPLTHWESPGIEPTSSWIQLRFTTRWATTTTPTSVLMTFYRQSFVGVD